MSSSLSRPVKLIALTVLLLLVIISSWAEEYRKKNTDRVALVIGNGKYSSSPLMNPVNDANDMAAVLSESGFDVLLRVDINLLEMEASLKEFSRAVQGKSTALFYYAGHAVQVGGQNFLLPVGEEISNSLQVRQRGISLDDVLDRIRMAGVETALVFLDACRDNPFPGYTRTGTRGLAVVSVPYDVETCIGYATQPGSTAQDGTGRNGVFTAALLANIKQPGTNLSDLMTSVIAQVKASTKGKQQPRFDNGLSAPFYFIDPHYSLERYKLEIEELDRQIEDRRKKIALTAGAKEKYDLELEQQKQEAIRTARKLEAENLARSTELQLRLDLEETRFQAGIDRQKDASNIQQDQLARMILSKRAELDKLARDTASDDPDILLAAAGKLSSTLREIKKQYSSVLETSIASVTVMWDKRFENLSLQKPDITETDQEFNQRISSEKARIEHGKSENIASLRASSISLESQQTKGMKFQYEETLQSIESRVWTARGKSIKLAIGDFDRNTRIWPMTISSNDPALPFEPRTLNIDLGRGMDPAKNIIEMAAAVKANALVGEVDWYLRFDREKERYTLFIKSYRVRNIGTDDIVYQSDSGERVAYFEHGRRKAPQVAKGRLVVSAQYGSEGTVFIDSISFGKTPVDRTLADGTYQVIVNWGDPGYLDYTCTVNIEPESITEISAAKEETPRHKAQREAEATANAKKILNVLYYIILIFFGLVLGV